MKNIQSIAGIAAVVQGVALAALLVFILVLLPRLGVGGNDLFTPAKILPASTSPLLACFYALFLTFGVTLVLIVLGLQDLLPGEARPLMRLATATAVVGLVGYTSFATLGLVLVSAAGHSFQQDPAAAASLPARLDLLHIALTIAPIGAVATTAIWGWAAAKTGALPAALCAVVIAASLLRIVTLFTQLPILVLLQLGGSVVWAWWLGIILLNR